MSLICVLGPSPTSVQHQLRLTAQKTHTHIRAHRPLDIFQLIMCWYIHNGRVRGLMHHVNVPSGAPFRFFFFLAQHDHHINTRKDGHTTYAQQRCWTFLVSYLSQLFFFSFLFPGPSLLVPPPALLYVCLFICNQIAHST